MNTGHPPYLAENYEDLREKIVKKDLPPPKIRGLCSVCLYKYLLKVSVNIFSSC